MELTDNQLTAIVFATIVFTVLLFYFTNQHQQLGGTVYRVEYPPEVIYINIVILLLCFASIIGLVKLLQRKGRSS
ncbi:MAG: hypothetical protein ACOC5L_01505 [Halobacteriota archaeon]